MSAQTITSLFQIEQAIEPAIAKVLGAQSSAQVLTSFTTQDEKFPRYEVRLELGDQAINDHQALVTIGGEQALIPDTWTGTIIVHCVANRTKDWMGVQAQLRGIARATLVGSLYNFPRSVLPFHELTIKRETGTVLSVAATEDSDTSETRFECFISIRPDAWPVS